MKTSPESSSRRDSRVLRSACFQFVKAAKPLVQKVREVLQKVCLEALIDSREMLSLDEYGEENPYLAFRESEEQDLYAPLEVVLQKTLRRVKEIVSAVKGRDGALSPTQLREEVQMTLCELLALAPHFATLDEINHADADDDFELIPSARDYEGEWSPEKENEMAFDRMGPDMKEIFSGLREVLISARAFLQGMK